MSAAPLSRRFASRLPRTLDERFASLDPSFQAKLAALAEQASKATMTVFSWWIEYGTDCSNGAQSAIFSEFIRWYATKLFGEAATDAKMRTACEALEAKFGWI